MPLRRPTDSKTTSRTKWVSKALTLLIPLALILLITLFANLTQVSTAIIAILSLSALLIVLYALSALTDMSFSEARNAALRELAKDVDKLLDLAAVEHLTVETAWSFGWPKIRIVFATQADLEVAMSSPKVDELRQYAGTAIQSNKVYGRGRREYDSKRALWLSVADSYPPIASPELKFQSIERIKRLSVALRYISIIALVFLALFLTLKDTYLFLITLFLGGVILLMWLAKRSSEKNLYLKAVRLAAGGRHAESLELLLAAEQVWSLNSLHSTPRTIRSDFERLLKIIVAMRNSVHELGGEVDTKDITQAIESFIQVYSERENFTFGTNDLKADPLERIESVRRKFPALRAKARRDFQSFWLRLGTGSS